MSDFVGVEATQANTAPIIPEEIPIPIYASPTVLNVFLAASAFFSSSSLGLTFLKVIPPIVKTAPLDISPIAPFVNFSFV